MDRRTVILAFGCVLLVTPCLSRAQSAAKTWRIGFLTNGSRPADGGPPPAFRQALERFGYIDGKNVTFVGRWSETKFERLPALASELVALDVDLLLTTGAPAADAAKAATSTIPIVVVVPGDADATGLVASLARPGGNVTGISDPATELSAKRLGLLKEAVPSATRVAVMWNENDRAMTLRYNEVERAARVLHVNVEPLGVRDSDDIDVALANMTRERPDALFLVADALTTVNRKRIIDFAAAHQIPAMYEISMYVRDGGLMSYGPNMDDMYRQAATYVDRIFKGAKPDALPVELPNKLELVIDLKTAKALGLTIPQAMQMRADDMIQ
jgi:putative tryptophan/tyrosine transport system substrate-binding protein